MNTKHEVKYMDKKFLESQIAFVDSAFFEFFNFKMVSGDPRTAVLGPDAVVLSRSAAQRYFGNEDPIGKELLVGENFGAGDIPLTVTGVIEDMPSNSHFHMDFMISMASGKEYFPESLYQMWGWDSGYTYVRLPEGMDAQDFNEKLIAFGARHIEGNWFIKFFSQPMVDIHLTSHLNSEIEANGDETYVYIFSIVALIIITLACVNYMNLATARSSARAKEIGIRKVVGAQKHLLVYQFLGESIVVTMLSLLLALGIAWLVAPIFTEFTGQELLNSMIENNLIVFGFAALTIMVALLSGLYPAFYLSSFKPSVVLKGNSEQKGSGFRFIRKSLVTFQFTLSTALIIGTIIVYNQLDFLRNKKLGVNTEQIMMLNLTSPVRNQFASFKNELELHSGIEAVTTSNKRVGRDINNGTFFKIDNGGEMSEARLSVIWIDYDYLNVYNVNIVQGRNFSMDFPSDTLGAVLLNQSALKALDITDPDDVVGKNLQGWQDFNPQVVGVIEDIHFEQLYNVIKPMIFLLSPNNGMNWASVKVADGSNLSEVISFVEKAWRRIEPDRDFRYSFLDDDLFNTYSAEEEFLSIFTSFSGIAIFIACLGVFGLASFTTSQRSREMGIRKVLGASVSKLSFLLAGDFLKLVLIANIIALPLAYWSMKNWLQNFAYSTQIYWWVFLIAAITATFIALGTVSFHSIKTAMTNPAKVLRDE